MCYLQTEFGNFNEEIKCGKPVKIYCCPCYFDSLVIAKFFGETCHDEILKFIDISEEQHMFSTMIIKTHCVMIYWEHVAFQLVIPGGMKLHYCQLLLFTIWAC